jgi:uncharacterized protein YoaH (UPF0181 family)
MKTSVVKTPDQRAGEVLLMERCRGLSSARTIEFLVNKGLISHTHLKAFIARESVERLVAKGVKKGEAMSAVAEAMGCSEATVKNYIYYNYK